MSLNAEHVLSGSFGYIEVDGVVWAEINGFQLSTEISYADVHVGMEIDQKMLSRKGTGNISVHKVYSRAKPLLEKLKAGKTPRINIVVWVADPDATDGKTERVSVKNAKFTTLNILNFKHGEKMEEEYPFTCRVDDIVYLDAIEP